MNLTGKTILITGAARRIGRDLSLFFAGAGARILVHYNTSFNEADALLLELKSIGDFGHKIIRADLSKKKDIDSLVLELDSVDVLINNAAMYINVPLAVENIDIAKEQFDVNFWAPYLLLQGLKKKRGDKESVAINISDCWASSKLTKNDGSYLISKASLEMLTKLAALQFAPSLRINAIALGHILPTKDNEHLKMQSSIEKSPLKTLVEIREIFSTCMFLIENKNITGEILYLDAGLHI